MQHNKYPEVVAQPRSTFDAIGLLIMWAVVGALIWAMPARSEPVSLSGQIANARLISETSSALFAYARRVEALAYDQERASWVRADVTAATAYRRLVWYVSALQMSATAAEVDEFVEVAQMVDALRDLHDQIIVSAKSGDRAATGRLAVWAGAVVDQINDAFQRIESRGYDSLHETAMRVAAVD